MMEKKIMGAGKGSNPRKVNKKVYDQNFDEINWKSKKDLKTNIEKEEMEKENVNGKR